MDKKELLIQAWKEVFDVDEVAEDADFFEEGGDSIKAVQLSSWLMVRGVKLDLAQIFNKPYYPRWRRYSRIRNRFKFRRS